jgi:hypothetical protein
VLRWNKTKQDPITLKSSLTGNTSSKRTSTNNQLTSKHQAGGGRSKSLGDLVSTTTLGFGVIGKFDTKEQAVAATVAEGQKRIDEQIRLQEAKAS